MRLDLFLKESRLIKRRTQAKEACDEGKVLIGGAKAKAGREVKVGDQIELYFPGRRLLIQIERLPEGSIPKAETTELYSILQEERRTCVEDF